MYVDSTQPQSTLSKGELRLNMLQHQVPVQSQVPCHYFEPLKWALRSNIDAPAHSLAFRYTIKVQAPEFLRRNKTTFIRFKDLSTANPGA